MVIQREPMPPSSHRLGRRAFLCRSAASALLSLPAWQHSLARPSQTAPAGTAKSVVLLWLWGGPSQLDTWDPKPNAPLEFRGPFSTIATRTTGLRICELFPKIAERTHKLAVIRSLNTTSNDHGIAGTIGLTGSASGGVDLGGKAFTGAPQPAMGSVVARARQAQLQESVPAPFVVIGGKLHQGKKSIIGEGGGRLGAAYDPFRLEYDPEQGTRIPALQLPAQLTPERLADRAALQSALDRTMRWTESRGFDERRSRALSLIGSPSARTMFDLSREPEKLVNRYGRTRFGQSCLLARRLVEAGVPFVQVNWSDHVEAEEDSGDGGWDHHYRNFQIMQDRHAVWLDQAYSTFLDDLDDRGLLASTLVLAVGEFGREPKINDKSGREHWPGCYSALVAGGGVAGGRVIGSSDARAARPHDTPVTPGDLCATVSQAIGLTSEQITGMGLLPAGQPIEGLF